MINKKGGLSVLLSVVLMWQSAFVVFAGYEQDTENTVKIYSTDFSDYVTGELVGDKQLNQPVGWTFEKGATYNSNKAYADIATDSVGSMTGVPYLKLYTSGEGMSETIKATKEFELPGTGEGIVRTKFRYSTNHGNFVALAKIVDSSDKGVGIGSAWGASSSWPTGGVVDGETQTPYGSGDYRIYVSGLIDDTGVSLGNYPIGTAYGSDDSTWRNIEIVINTSEEKVETEIADKKITLGGGVYAVALTLGETTNVLKGNLPWGVGKLCKFTLATPEWTQGSEVRLDELSVEYTPIVYVDNRFTNQVTVTSNGANVTATDDISADMKIENKLMNKGLSDKDAVVLAALYRDGYMINSTAEFAEKVPYSVSGDENVFKKVDMTLKTSSDSIFGDVELKVFTLDSFDKILAKCDSFVISDNAQGSVYTTKTTTPKISEYTNLLSYCGINTAETNVTYAVVKGVTELTSDMTAKDFAEALYYFGEVKSNNKGKYAFDIKFAGENSDYTLLVNDGESLKTYTLAFKNKLAENLVSSISGSRDVTELKTNLASYLEAVRYDNGLYNKYISDIKAGTEFYNIFYNEMQKNPVASKDEILNLVNVCTLMYGLNKGTNESEVIQNLGANIELIDLDRIYSKDLYSDKTIVDDTVKSLIFSKFAGSFMSDAQLAGDVEKFHDTLGDTIILAICEKTVGAAYGSKVIAALYSKYGAGDAVLAQTYTVYSAMASEKRTLVEETIMGKSYASIDDLKTAFQTAVTNAGNQVSTDVVTTVTPSYGGGGGGGSSSTQRPVLIPTVEPTLTVPEYTLPAKGEALSFDDLNEAAWSEQFVTKLSERGIVSGDENGNFNPNTPVLREEFVTMLIKLLGIDTLYVGSSFSDVPNDAWYYEYVSAAYEKGIVTGTDSNNFGSGGNITREDLCVMIYRALKAYGVYIPDSDCEKFSDDESLSDYACEAVYALKTLGVIDGFSDGTFAPRKNASRAESAKILSMILDYLEEESNLTDTEVTG